MDTATRVGTSKYGKNTIDTTKNKEMNLLKQLVREYFKKVQKQQEI